MRIVRCSAYGQANYGVVRDEEVHLLDRSPFGVEGPVETGRVVALEEATLLTPTEPSTIYAIGRNYAEHAKEMGYQLTGTPSAFLKPRSSLLPPGGTVVLPPPSASKQVQHEAELVIVIG